MVRLISTLKTKGGEISLIQGDIGVRIEAVIGKNTEPPHITPVLQIAVPQVIKTAGCVADTASNAFVKGASPGQVVLLAATRNFVKLHGEIEPAHGCGQVYPVPSPDNAGINQEIEQTFLLPHDILCLEPYQEIGVPILQNKSPIITQFHRRRGTVRFFMKTR